MGKPLMKKLKANNPNESVFSIVRSDGAVLAQFSPEEGGVDLDGAMQWLQMGVDLVKRRIELTGEVGENMAAFVIRALTKMNEINHDPITIHLQTYGGGVLEGFSIYDAMIESKSPIIVKGSGKIASMGIVIFLAGTERTASPNTRFMIHSLSHNTEGKLKDTLVDVTEAKISNDAMYKIIAERSKIKLKTLQKLNGDLWFGVTEAKNMGIIKESNKQKQKVRK